MGLIRTPGSERDQALLQSCLAESERLVEEARVGEARKALARALAWFPRNPSVWNLAGRLHLWAREDDAAERCFRRALELDPDFCLARTGLAQLRLRQGRFEEGWAHWEHRPLNLAFQATLGRPPWSGGDPAGKAFLVGQEAGLGDTIQFFRFAAALKGRGARRVGIVCYRPLQRLLEEAGSVDRVVPLGEPVPDEGWDAWVLPMSLPRLLGTAGQFQLPVPYLRADERARTEWEARLPPGRPRVGLVWRGNPRYENDARRSLPSLATLAPLAGLTRFVSLQVGEGEEEARQPPAGMDLLDVRRWIGDLADTAALVAGLDLVIAVDTAVAHLAGALGVPCWVLLPRYRTDWRWMEGREDTPWYPGTHRLFRQGPGEGWGPVVARVAAALKAKLHPGTSFDAETRPDSGKLEESWLNPSRTYDS
jgi:hypothetical protein